MRKVGLGILFVLAALLAAHTLTYLSFDPQQGFLRLKQDAVNTGWYLPAYYSHILAGAIVLVAGFLQFNTGLRIQKPMIHRGLGVVYVFLILFFSAPGGMVMAFFIQRGPLVLASFILQCSMWFAFTAVAFRKVKAGDYAAHERWMYRSYALTFAAVTLRLYIFLASWWIDLSQPAAYALFAWLSWLPNLAAAEIILAKKLRPAAS